MIHLKSEVLKERGELYLLETNEVILKDICVYQADHRCVETVIPNKWDFPRNLMLGEGEGQPPKRDFT